MTVQQDRSVPATEDVAPHALAGLRVVSMAEQYPGPFCTMILSDMGADVIQVERPGTGDPSRFLSAFYESVNRGKRSVALDIRQPEAKRRLLELLADADVFLEGFRPGKLAKQGLAYEDVRAINPGIVYCSISGYGQTGPYRDRPAHDLTYQGIGGALAERIEGQVRGLPPSLLLGDTASALYAAIGILGALLGRERTGRGTYIDISMADTVTAAMTVFVGMLGQETPAPPQAEPGYDLFECADGRFLTLSIAHEDAQWDRLCADLGMDDAAGLIRTERVERRTRLHARIAGAIAAQPFTHWEAVFEASGQMWGPANRIADLPDDPQIRARGLMERLTRADGVAQWVLRQPIRFSAYENAPLTPAPGLGEHDGAGFISRTGT